MDKPEFATDDMKSVMYRIMQMMEESEQDLPTSPPMTDSSYPESVASESSVHTVQYQELANLSKVEVQQEQATPSPTKKISTKQFLTKTLARMNNRTQKSIEQLKKTKEKVEEEISAVCTHKPNISDAGKLKEQAPLHERYKAYLQEKNKKLSEITARVVEEREKVLMKDLTFKPKIKAIDDERKRTVEQVASECEEWREKKLIDIEMIKEKILEEERQNLTFRPELNKNSLEIWLRMKEEGKLPEKFGFDKSKSSRFQMAERDSRKDLLFRPQIRKKNPNLNKSASNSVFERLFPGGNVKLNTLASNPLLMSNSTMNLSLSKTDRPQFNRSSSPGYHEHPSPDPHQKQVDPRHKLNASISVTTLHESKKYIKPVISEKPVKFDPKPIKKIIEKPKSEKKIIEKPKPEKKIIEKPKFEKKADMTRSQTTPKIITKKPSETQQKPSVSIEDEFLAAKLRMEAARLERQEATEKTNTILLTSIQEERSKYSEIISSKVEVTVATTEQTSVTIEATSEEVKKKFDPNVDYVTKAMEEGLMSKGVFSSYDIKNPSNIYTHYTSRASDASEITSTSNENRSEEICL